MKSWLAQWFMAPPALRPAIAGPAPGATGTPHERAARCEGEPLAALESTATELEILAWITEGAALSVGPAGPRERAALRSLDRLLADTSTHPRLLPRAAAVIPPLLARLRDPRLSLAELTPQVACDVTLAAEVIRTANSARYRGGAVVTVLDHAVRQLGIDGLRSAIARAVLKPLMDRRSSPLAARCAARLWEHTDRKAQLCSALARDAGIDPFEACLAGMAHNAVWSAVLRTLDETEGDRPWHLGPSFAHALGMRRDRLFAVVAQQWQLADWLAPADANAAPMHLLHRAEGLAWLLCMPDRPCATALAEPLLRNADATLRECYDALATGPAGH